MTYRLARFIIHLIVNMVTRVRIEGYENVVPLLHAPAIVVSNHLGRLDAVLVYSFLDRRDVTMLVAEKYHKVALFRWFVRVLNAVWVDRYNADLGAMRTALQRLKEGHVLVLAPEGTRSNTGALIEGRSGSSYLASRSGVPVVPVGVTGSEDRAVLASLRRLRRAQICVRIGKPFQLPPLKANQREKALKEYTDEIMCQIAALLPPEYRGVYANHPRLGELLATEEQIGREVAYDAALGS
jgi:1-acyl-sn-glycerol-3-phosphate acyltransferase